ncbi:MAG: glycosyltransferase family 4 protein [Gemmatimonadota bacterium]
MKIAILIHGGVDRSGSVHVIPAVLWLLERLARRHEVHVFSFNQEPRPAEWELLGATIHNVGPGRGWRGRLLRAFREEHRASSFRVIQGIFGWGGTYGALLGWLFRVPVAFHCTGGELVTMPEIGYGLRSTRRGRFELRVALRGATRVTVPSHHLAHTARAIGVQAQLIPFGVATDRWPLAVVRARDTRRRARLLHVGDLRPVKDQAVLLAAAVRMRDDGLDFTLDVVGLDTMNGALQQSSHAQALRDIVRWHGVLDRQSLRALMDSADVLIVSSRHEAEPMVLLEAAIAGVPSVGTAVGHFTDWAPYAAVAVPVRDATALARETIALLADEPRRLAIARAAQARALAFDADATAAAFETMFAEICI